VENGGAIRRKQLHGGSEWEFSPAKTQTIFPLYNQTGTVTIGDIEGEIKTGRGVPPVFLPAW
jgi:hypothetical protein